METIKTSLSNATILIVDDSEICRLLLERHLQILGCKIRSAYNGKTALQSINENVPSIILLDVNMPDMTGYDLVDILRTEEKTKNIPVVFVSASEYDSTIVEKYMNKNVDYILKPYIVEKAVEKIKNILETRNEI